MSAGGHKCKNCGSADIEVDSARGDAVCTNCGSVLEDNIIVSEVQFEENHAGVASAVGQFVSADSKGGATGYGKFQVGSGVESREVTLRKARQGITHLCHQLNLNNHCIDTACNFFKMALMRHLTRGRKNSHIYAACVYITCRTEGTSHLLIDISDVLQICCYELGKTYLKLSQSLCINIPSIDPCLYIMRFANKLEFGEKTHEVSMTAQRLVQRMKKDFIHSGRRPSGLCGAALLLAARMHEFNRTPIDIVRIVKIHESTLRKRLLEFGETPSSALTLDEFMTVDLEAEQDPPAFKLARKRDKERLQKLNEIDPEFNALTQEIDSYLDKDLMKNRKRKFPGNPTDELELSDTDEFIRVSTINVIKNCLSSSKAVIEEKVEEEEEEDVDNPEIPNTSLGLKPDIAAMCLPSPIADVENNAPVEENADDGMLDLEGIDDDEISGYIMTESEAQYKDLLWNKLNAEYLIEFKAREEKLAKEREEGQPDKKRRRAPRKKHIGPSNTAGEAIEKMLQEKKISNKINYDILKTLTAPLDTGTEEATDEVNETPAVDETPEPSSVVFSGSRFNSKPDLLTTVLLKSTTTRRNKIIPAGLQIGGEPDKPVESSKTLIVETGDAPAEEADDFEDEPEPEPEPEHSSLADMLKGDGDEEYYGYDEEY